MIYFLIGLFIGLVVGGGFGLFLSALATIASEDGDKDDKT